MDHDRDKIIDRIEKLLRLSRSSNEHEAAAAAARAADLMREHRLSEAELKIENGEEIDEPVVETPIEERARGVPWRGILAFAVARSMGCSSFSSGGAIVILGHQSGIRAVTYTFQFLAREVGRLAEERWANVLAEGRLLSPRRWKNSFRLGAASTIASRLHEQRQQFDSEAAEFSGARSNALVVVRQREKAVETYVRGLGLRSAPGPRASSTDGYRAGAAAGRSMSLGASSGRLAAPPPQLRDR